MYFDNLPPRIPPVPSSSPSLEHNATIQELQSQIARQNLMIQTLCRILVAKGVIQEQELSEWLKYVDGLDGAQDGRLREAKTPKSCPKCRRTNPYKAVKCQYCGEEFPPLFFDFEQPADAK